LTFQLGGFVPIGEDARVRSNGFSNDVLVSNLDFLSFRLRDFNGATVGAEYSVGLGPFLDASLGTSFYRRTVPSVYTDLVNQNGTEIEQEMKLRINPYTATIRFLPLGRNHGISPYLGAGLGVFNWRYAETGDFVDSSNNITRGSFVGTGTATGPVILGGINFPMDTVSFGGEVKYQRARGDLPGDQGFSADKIDLGGWSTMATFSVRF
jgi:hypothetical protein